MTFYSVSPVNVKITFIMFVLENRFSPKKKLWGFFWPISFILKTHCEMSKIAVRLTNTNQNIIWPCDMATILRVLWLAAKRGRFFFALTGHYEDFTPLVGSLKLWGCEGNKREGGEKILSKFNYLFNNWKRNTAFSPVNTSSNDLLRASGYWKTLPAFFQRLKGHTTDNLLISSVRSLQGNLRPRPLTLLFLGHYNKASVRGFPVMTPISVNKWHSIDCF